MSPALGFTEDSLVVIDHNNIALALGWTETAVGSNVTRIGSLVTISMQVKNIAEPAWVEATTYAAKEVVSEGGSIYESIAGANKEHKPSSDAGVHWKLLTSTPTKVCTLPADYAPAVTTVTEDGKFSVATTGVVTATFALTAAASSFIPFQLSYVAAVGTP